MSDFDPRSSYCATDSIGYLLRRAHKLSLALAEESFLGEELSFTQWIALIQLRDGMIDTAGALARCLDHDSGATTRMLDQLESRGLIGRQRGVVDRRVVHLTLTDKGRAAANRLVPHIMALWDGILADFATADVALLTGLLKRLVGRLEAGGGRIGA